MSRLWRAVFAGVLLGSAPLKATADALPPVPRNGQTPVVVDYLRALRGGQYARAYQLLNAAERAYYRDARNFASIFAADAYRITGFTLLGARGDDTLGRVYFVRESAVFRDHAHDVDLAIHATVPVGVVADHGRWRIKDPGHPWHAFATSSWADVNGVRVTVKKLSFFARRIEAVVSFTNEGSQFVTVLAYGRSILHDDEARPYRIIETRDWSLTDKTLFEGLRLAPGSRYTGTLAFVCQPQDNAARTYSLTVAPMLRDGADAPFAIEVDGIAANPPAR